MSEKIITITVPAYNAQDYIGKCMDSLITDSEEVNKIIEVFIVNDGSTDGTERIAQQYVESHPEMFRLINKQNGGHGSGINAGIDNATGKYFKILDADDWLNENEWKDYVQMLRTLDVDIVASDYLCIQDGTYSVLKGRRATEKKKCYGKICKMSKGEITNVIKMHSMTIRTEILQQNRIRIDEHCFYVDQEYVTYPVPFIETVYYDRRFLYMYRLERSGQSMNVRNMQKNQKQHRFVMDQMLDKYKKTSFEDKEAHKIYFEHCIAQMVESHYQIFLSKDNVKRAKSDAKRMDEMLRENYFGVYRAVTKRTIWMIRRSGYLLFGLGSRLYHILKM